MTRFIRVFLNNIALWWFFSKEIFLHILQFPWVLAITLSCTQHIISQPQCGKVLRCPQNQLREYWRSAIWPWTPECWDGKWPLLLVWHAYQYLKKHLSGSKRGFTWVEILFYSRFISLLWFSHHFFFFFFWWVRIVWGRGRNKNSIQNNCVEFTHLLSPAGLSACPERVYWIRF